MSNVAFSSYSAPNQALLDPRAHWITPEEQLERLHLPIAKTIELLVLPIFGVAKLVAEYTGLDESVTNWYEALKLLNSLPSKIPPLPANIYQIMNGKCPIHDDKRKADKTAYKIKDTHSLILVLKEFGNLNRLERDILKPYGERVYSKKENPLQFRYFWHVARHEHADVPFPETHFILMANELLPKSMHKTLDEHTALVNKLSQKAFVNYEIPTLQQSVVGITIDMIATGERRYQAGYDKHGEVDAYTRVKQTTRYQGSQDNLAVGGFRCSGVGVVGGYGYACYNVAVAPIRVLADFQGGANTKCKK